MDAKKKKFLIEYEKENWHISNACKKVKISRGAFYKWLKNDEEFQEEYYAVKERDLDDTELELKKLEMAGNPTAIIFKLKTLGKERGYIERSELTGKDGSPVMKTDNPDDYSDEELKAMLKAKEKTKD